MKVHETTFGMERAGSKQQLSVSISIELIRLKKRWAFLQKAVSKTIVLPLEIMDGENIRSSGTVWGIWLRLLRKTELKWIGWGTASCRGSVLGGTLILYKAELGCCWPGVGLKCSNSQDSSATCVRCMGDVQLKPAGKLYTEYRVRWKTSSVLFSLISPCSFLWHSCLSPAVHVGVAKELETLPVPQPAHFQCYNHLEL